MIMGSVLYNLEVIHNGEWVYKTTVHVQIYETIEQVKQRYRKLIAYSRMTDESELEVDMGKYQYVNS
jgi:hypothetical protein